MEEEAEKKGEVSPEDRLTKLEDSMESVKGLLTKVADAVVGDKDNKEGEKPLVDENKADEEEETTKKEHEEEVVDKKEEEEEKRKQDEDKPEEKNKEGDGEDIKLPKASAGETDESANIEGDKITISEKNMKDIIKSANKDLLKSMGITKSTTPRTSDFVNKGRETDEGFAYDIIKGSRDSKKKYDAGDVTRMIKKKLETEENDRMSAFFGGLN